MSKNLGFNKCCALQIKWLWDKAGGSENVIHYAGTCSKCDQYIGLTHTKVEEAILFLKEFDLVYEINPERV